MSSKHTPGPWKITGETGDGKRIYVESDMERDNRECPRCEVDSDDCDSDMAMANARLIAAAPDLLAACEAAVEAIEEHVSDEPEAPAWAAKLHKQLEAAIAKARIQ